MTPDLIKQAVADYYNATDDYGITVEKMEGKTRRAEIVRARHVAMYLIQSKLGLTQRTIGKLFGGREHSTVVHAIQTVKDQYMSDVAAIESLLSRTFSIAKLETPQPPKDGLEMAKWIYATPEL